MTNIPYYIPRYGYGYGHGQLVDDWLKMDWKMLISTILWGSLRMLLLLILVSHGKITPVCDTILSPAATTEAGKFAGEIVGVSVPQRKESLYW